MTLVVTNPRQDLRGLYAVADAGQTSGLEEGRAIELGRWLESWRLKRGLKRPEAVQRALQHNPHIRLSQDYLAKLEYGKRNLAKASPDLREALRFALRIPADIWERETGFSAQEVEVRKPDSDDEFDKPTPRRFGASRRYSVPPAEPLPIEPALLQAAELYGDRPGATALREYRWQRWLNDQKYQSKPETPEDWLVMFHKVKDSFDPADPQE